MVRRVPCRPQHEVDLVVAVAGVVVEERKLTNVGLLGDVHRVVDGAVPPMTLLLELGRRVLRIVDQQVDTVAELEDVVGNEVVGLGLPRSPAAPMPPALTVVGEVRDRDALPLEPVPERRTDVADPPGPHLGGGRHREVVVADVVELHRALELLGRDREVRRPHHPGEDLTERALLLARAVDVERVPGAVHRHEERQALHVIPVEVAEQQDGSVEIGPAVVDEL